jgi:hypothetical protein
MSYVTHCQVDCTLGFEEKSLELFGSAVITLL